MEPMVVCPYVKFVEAVQTLCETSSNQVQIVTSKNNRAEAVNNGRENRRIRCLENVLMREILDMEGIA